MYLNFIGKIIISIGLFNYLTSGFFKLNFMGNRILQIIVGVVGLYFIIQRDYYLPFLGETVVPLGNIPLTVSTLQTFNQKTTNIQLKDLPRNVKVLYWAAESDGKSTQNWMDAYNNYSNSGIVMSNSVGQANIQIKCPSQYTVSNKTLPRHLHYRYELPSKNGILSRVFTYVLQNEC